VSGAVLDTGALIAIERGDRHVIGLVVDAEQTRATLTVPAGCVAQAWRHPRRQARLAAFLRRPYVDIVALDADDARRVGLVLAASGTTDVIDAHVAVCALRRGWPVLTSDPKDISALAPTVLVHRV
jgi:predicted nucleic acid-binding protein